MTAGGGHRLLVTGGLGYVGSRLIRDLGLADAEPPYVIRILDNLQRSGFEALMGLPEHVEYEFLEGDILDPAAVRRALRGVDSVIHLAAIVRTPLSFDHPEWTEQVNHWGTARLLEQCLESGVLRFILTSSTSVYGPGGPATEETPCRPVGPYAESKLRAEEAALAAADRGLALTVLRLGTVFGLAPVTRFDGVANRLAYLAGVGRAPTVFGIGDQRRSMLHVADAAAAIRLCLTHDAAVGGLFNVVGTSVSIMDLVTAIQAIRPELEPKYTEQHVMTHWSFEADGSRFEAVLGWKPRHTLHEGLDELIRRFGPITAPALA